MATMADRIMGRTRRRAEGKPVIIRQGDVLLVWTDILLDRWNGPAPAARSARVVLALGEVTGHAHVVVAEKDDLVLFDNGKGFRILKVGSEAELVHEEHETKPLPPGAYRVIQQREWDAGLERRVED